MTKKILLAIVAVAVIAFLTITIYKAYFEDHHEKKEIVDGKDTDDPMVVCDICNVDGNIPGHCPFCKGTGIFGSPTILGDMIFETYCPVCQKNKGKCFNCQGTGMIPRSQLGKAILPIPDPNNTSSQPTSTSREVPCTNCNGTGFVLKEYGIGHSFVHENARMEKCSVCESVHCNMCANHTLCPACDGKKTRPAYWQ